MRMNEVKQLLKANISKAQLLGYALANQVGLTVILCGIMFYADSRHQAADSDQYFAGNHVVISKKVEGLGFTPVNFSEEEISELERQPWVKKFGKFSSSQFAVKASVNMGGRGLSTYLFFESVPDEFFDIAPAGWHFDPRRSYVPIILSKDYLTLYNFGFAVPQGLPQVSEKIISSIPIDLTLTGNELVPEHFDASIVGFSSRLNTIAVPQSFMDWANARYAPGDAVPPSRLILEVDAMQSREMQRYFADNDMEQAGEDDGPGKVSDFLSVVSTVVTANGVVISLLALFILLLSIFLLLQKSRGKLRNLMLLGYSPGVVGRYYQGMVVGLNAAIVVVALGLSMGLRELWSEPLQSLGLGGASVMPAILTVIGYLLVVTAINVAVIRKNMTRIWRG